MHIGFLTPEYPHSKVSYSAGIGTSLKNLIDSMVQLGCKISLFVYNQSEFEYIEEGNLTIHLLKNIAKWPLPWLENRKRINRYVQYYVITEKIDLIEVPDWTGISAMMKFSCPVVCRLHGSDGFFCFLENRKQKLKNRYLEKFALSTVDAIISPNDFTLLTTQKVFGIRKVKKLGIINLGIDLRSFADPDLEGFEEKTVYYIGTLIRKKGVFMLPSIFEEILKIEPKAKFIFIGNDSPDVFSGSKSTWKLLKKEFSENVLNQVEYLGKINYSDIISHLKKANVCVFPSMAETTGMVTLEAMAMGKAVIASNEDWSQAIIENGVNGFRIDPQDATTFASVVCDLLNNSEKVKKVGYEARMKIENEFDARIIAQKNLTFYQELVSGDYTDTY